jgi:hypothetical protein
MPFIVDQPVKTGYSFVSDKKGSIHSISDVRVQDSTKVY